MAEYRGNSLVLFPSMVGFKLGLWQSGMNLWHLIVSSLWLPWWLPGGKESAVMQEIKVQSLGQEDPLEKEMATHSSILAWEIP